VSPRSIALGSRRIGAGEPVFVIAEAGVNHNGDAGMARRLVDAAADAGADAVKFQTWVTELLIAQEAPLAEYQARNIGGGKSQFQMLKELELDRAALPGLKRAAEARGLTFFSTPDEEDSADFLEGLGVPLFKIGSAEVTNLELLRHVARKRRPLILSTGMSTLDEVERAVRAIEDAGNRELVLLHCVSDYPSRPADSNLRAMATLARAFGYPVGFSDHTPGHVVAIAAVALGACVIEKHLTLDNALPGPDHSASLDAPAFAAMVAALRQCETALGTGRKEPAAAELQHRPLMRKRWVAGRALAAGTRLTRADLLLRRASPDGLDPSQLELLLGRELKRAVAALEVVTPEKLV
jgi:N-acetylneuraminate synthase/N,N'-diacetyllegionaminate synthase